MKWQGREESSNIEDRRSQGGNSGGGFGGGLNSGGPLGRGGGIGLPIGGRGGFSGIVGIVVLLLICWALGINPLSLLDNGSNTSGGNFGGGYSQSQPSNTADQQQLVDFVGVVVKDTE